MFIPHKILQVWTLIEGWVFSFIPFLYSYNLSYFYNLLYLLFLYLIILTWNSIFACRVLGKSILALEVDSKIFHEVLKPFLDAKLGENIVSLNFNLDKDFPI
jgi:hypothetical protein